MDALKGFDRNGLDSGYFDFVPPPLIAAGGGLAILKKKKQKKFQNQKAVDLSIKYPHKLTSDEQDQTISQVAEEQRKVVEEKNKSKGAKRSKLNSELKGYDEYLNDLRNVRDELLKKEQEAIAQLKQQVEETPRPTSTQEASKEDEIVQSASKTEVKVEENKDVKSPNTMLYVGIGLVVLVGIVLVMRNK
jgi:hypothetical protein